MAPPLTASSARQAAHRRWEMVGRDTPPRWVNPVTQLRKEHHLTWRTHACINRSPAHEAAPPNWRLVSKTIRKCSKSLKHIWPIIPNSYHIPGNVLSELCTLSPNWLDINILQAPVWSFLFPEKKLNLFRKASELETNINGDKVTKHTQ